MRVHSLFIAAGLIALGACKPTQNVIQLPTLDAGRETRDAGIGRDAEAAPDADGGASVPRTWHQDVAPILQRRCSLCHGDSPNFGAPMSLYSYEDAIALKPAPPGQTRQPYYELMAFRVYARTNPMPPADQFLNMITDEERTVLRQWAEQGAPEGSPEADAGPASADAGVDAGRPDGGMVPDAGGVVLSLRANDGMGGPFPFPVAGADTDYSCFAYTIPPGTPNEQYAIAFRTHLGVNTQHVHHLLIFHNQDIANPVDTTRPFSCPGFSVTWNLISGWFPGRPDETLPPNVGVRLRPGEQLILQNHYDRIPPGSGLTDDSGLDVEISYQRGMISGGNLWQGVIFGLIQGSDEVLQTTCTITRAINVFSVFPHMHENGTTIILERENPPNSGTWDRVVEIPQWTFGTQPIFPINPHLALVPGDRIRTTCHYNTMGRVVSWGEGSSQEMCFNFLFHYPLVPDTQACVEQQR